MNIRSVNVSLKGILTVTPGFRIWQSTDLNILVFPNCNCIPRQVSIHIRVSLCSIFTGQLQYLWPSANMQSGLQQGCKEKNASPICTMRMKEKVYFFLAPAGSILFVAMEFMRGRATELGWIKGNSDGWAVRTANRFFRAFVSKNRFKNSEYFKHFKVYRGKKRFL